MKSWRTTTFGCLAACGTALIAAERTGVIDGSTIPMWMNQVACLASVIGTACLGVFAHDAGVPTPAPIKPEDPKP